jgi:tetraacyldisaccharide 4'-kinase
VTALVVKPLELLWRGVNRLRRFLYRRGVLKPQRLPRPVISVGNLAAGGAGKTPAVIAIARDLIARGLRVAVLTRGYGRATDATGVVTSMDAARFGDEPVLLKMSLQNVHVIVGHLRYENATLFLAQNDCDVFVLDDGFQHLQLARDVDVVIDAPAARILREGPSALRDADFVIPRNLRLHVPDVVRGRRLFAFSGLADNEQFFAALRAEGLDVASTRGFRDHHRYTAADVAALRKSAHDAGAEALVTTAKDAVKISDHDIIVIAAEMIIEPAVLDAIAARISAHRQR